MKTKTILVWALICTFCSLVKAQVEIDREPRPVKFMDRNDPNKRTSTFPSDWPNIDPNNIVNLKVSSIDDISLPEGVRFSDLDKPTKETYLKLVDKYFQYHISAYQHREKVFAWQHFSSQIIFIVVFILVGVGVYFSWLQFRQSLESMRPNTKKQAKKAKDADSIASKEIETTQLEVSTKGIKVSSSVLGVIILVISLLFFYLYLVHVYPIREIQ